MLKTKARKTLRETLLAEFKDATESDLSALGHSKRTQQIMAAYVIDLAGSKATDRSNKALREAFDTLLTRVKSELAEGRTGVMINGQIHHFQPMAGFKLVPIDPIKDSPAYGM